MLNYMLTLFHAFWADEEGASALEYGLIIGLIAIALIGALYLIGDNLGGFFDDIAECVEDPGEANC